MTKRPEDEITDAELERYARHVILPEVGEEGQAKLLRSKVLVIGAGGLGAPALLYLAAAGVGTLGVIDDDEVDITNLQRQVIHTTPRIGVNKAASAKESIAALNPEITVEIHETRLSAANAAELIGAYDLVIDGSDNFETRYLLNDACFLAGKPLVSAALLRFEGQISTYKAHEGEGHPCYRCLFPAAPAPGTVPRCDQAGIFGAIAGIMGSLQAAEALKELLGLGNGLSGRLVTYDALAGRFHETRFKKDPACALCGPQATITDLSGHGA